MLINGESRSSYFCFFATNSVTFTRSAACLKVSTSNADQSNRSIKVKWILKKKKNNSNISPQSSFTSKNKRSKCQRFVTSFVKVKQIQPEYTVSINDILMRHKHVFKSQHPHLQALLTFIIVTYFTVRADNFIRLPSLSSPQGTRPCLCLSLA